MALTKVSGDFLQDGSITQGHLHASHGITTTHIAEGDKLFFTNARVDSRIGSLSSSDLSEGTNLYYTDARARAAISANGSLSYNSTTGVMSFTMPAQNTSNITEGTNLYYTDARVDARITAADTDSLSEGSTNLYYTDARADARVALIVDSAPGTLNTLNELAAALGDDANFSTTVTNSIATKLPLAGGTITGQVNFSVAPFLTQGVDLIFKAASGSTDPGDLVWRDGSDNEKHRIWDGTNTLNYRTAGGTTYQLIHSGYSSYNNSNWDTAYGWGNHASAGYITSFDITTQTDPKYLRSDADDTATGTITVSGKDGSFIADYDVAGSVWSGRIISKNDTTGVASFLGNYNGFPGVFAHNSALNAWNSIFINTLSTSGTGNANVYTGTLYVNGNLAWHAGNDGSGSGLDADLLDGVQGNQFLRSTTAPGTSGTNANTTISIGDNGTSYAYVQSHGSKPLNFNPVGNTVQIAGNTIWHAGNDGSGSGLDADLLDGIDSASFVRSDANDSLSGQYTFTKTDDHAIKVGTIRGTAVGSQAGEFIQMYERVNIGGPSGWGAANTATPSYGLSTYGGTRLAVYTDYTESGGSMRAPIFYDSNNTGYYTDPAGVSILSYAQVYNLYDAQGARFTSPEGGVHFTSGSVQTGMIRIKIPANRRRSSTMMQMTINVYQYSTGKSFTIRCGGYNYSGGNWYNEFAHMITDQGMSTLNVRFGDDGTNDWICIGETNSTWDYCQVMITDFQGGYSGTTNAWGYGWGIDFVTSIPAGHTNTRATSLALTSNNTSNWSTNLYAPIFYDSNNTAFYVDPNGTSNLSTLSTGTNEGIFNNQRRNHSTTQNFNDTALRAGINYLQQGTNGPTGTANHQWYGWRLGLGGEYGTQTGSSGHYAQEWYIARKSEGGNNTGGNFLWTRDMEGGNWGSWAKIDTDRLQLASGYYASQGDWGLRNTTPYGWIQFGPANTSHAHIYTDRSNFYFNAQIQLLGGSLINQNDIRAGVFYDVNDTGYYLDPNSTSNVNAMTFAGVADFNGGHGGINITNTSILSSPTSNWTGNPGGAGKIQYHANRWYIVSDSSSNRIVQFRRDGADKCYIDNDGRLMDVHDVRAYVYYDRDDTTYYTNPASTSNMFQGYYKGKTDGWSLQLGDADTARIYDDDARASLVINTAYYPHIYLNANTTNSNTNHGAVFSMTGNISGGGFRRWSIGIPNTDPNMLTIGTYDNQDNPHYGCGGDVLGETTWGSKFWLDSSSNLQTNGSMRAPIFYDSNDTTYYTNPASTSSLKLLQTGQNHQVNAPRWDTSFYVAQSQHYYAHNSTQAIYIGESNTINIRSVGIATGSLRAPIFYDSNDTNYYTNPASTSALNAATFVGTVSGQNAYFAQSVGIGFTSGNIGGRLNVKNSAAGQIAAKLQLGGSVNSASTGVFVNTTASYASSGMFLHFQSNHISGDDNVLIAYLDGDIVNKNNSYTQYSDQRLKENIVDATSKLEEIKQIRVRNFNFIGEDLKQIGIVAQELEPIFPGLVKEREVPGHDDLIKTVKYSVLVPILIKAMQEQQTVIDDLKSRLETLENQ